jgi:hypothetical protein
MSESSIPAGTANGLIEFCDFLIEKGYATPSAVNPWKSAAKQVFSLVEGEGKDYGSINVLTLDFEDY